MKSTLILGVIALIGVFVVFYQYYFMMGIRFALKADFNTDGPTEESSVFSPEELESCVGISNLNEKMIRSAVRGVQEANGLSSDFATSLIQELINRNSVFGHDPVEIISSKMTREPTNGQPSSQQPLRNSSEISRIQVSSQNVPKMASNFEVSSENADLTNSVRLYIITATYRRPEQIPQLIRVSQALMQVKNIHWLVIEDAKVPTSQVTRMLERTGLEFTHLIAPMPDVYRNRPGKGPRGVSNRNRGLEWIRAHVTHGVFYFADDDNTYDIPLFDEIRRTKRVSMFPVGLCTSYGLSSPILRNGKFAGFYNGWIAGRKFPMDNAGYAVNVEFLLQRPKAIMPYVTGFQEDGFLKSLAPFEPWELEFLADHCMKIYAWHTQSLKYLPSAPLDMKLYGNTNLVELKKQVV